MHRFVSNVKSEYEIAFPVTGLLQVGHFAMVLDRLSPNARMPLASIENSIHFGVWWMPFIESSLMLLDNEWPLSSSFISRFPSTIQLSFETAFAEYRSVPVSVNIPATL